MGGEKVGDEKICMCVSGMLECMYVSNGVY